MAIAAGKVTATAMKAMGKMKITAIPEFYGEQNFSSRSGYRPNDGGDETYDDGDEYREDEY